MLSNNRLGGSLSCEMVGASLAELDITGNQVAGSIPACVVNSPAMREVYLSGNKLSGALPTLAGNNDLLIISASSQARKGTAASAPAPAQAQRMHGQHAPLTHTSGCGGCRLCLVPFPT